MIPTETIIAEISSSENYRIIKRFERVRHYNEPNDVPKSIGIFVDVETTGSNPNTHHMIEMALVPFEYTSDGRIYRIFDSYVEFQDPNVPIPKSIVELTGITNEMVSGKSFNTAYVNDLVNSASIIIAHHAAFDKKFVEKTFPIFKKKPWGCTVAHIRWKKEKIASAKLEYLAYKFGVFYEAHRAEIDSLIGIHILSQKLPVSNELALKILLENADGQYFKIWAENSPFHMKDTLKARGYKWNDGTNKKPKSWYKIVSEKLKEQELEFLYKEIYDRYIELKIETVNPFERD